MNEGKMLEKDKKPRGSILFQWLDHRNSSSILIGLLTTICFGLFLSDFIYHRHGHFSAEEIPGFYAFYGFVMFSIIILCATVLRFFVRRHEDYYGSKAVDGEIGLNEDSEDSE